MKIIGLTIRQLVLQGREGKLGKSSVRRKVDQKSKLDAQERAALPRSAGWIESVQRPKSRITRDVFHARLACPSHDARRTNQTIYRNHSISTTQSRDGKWVAAFGRLDGGMMDETAQFAVLETPPHLVETIALADAQILIDARLRALS